MSQQRNENEVSRFQRWKTNSSSDVGARTWLAGGIVIGSLSAIGVLSLAVIGAVAWKGAEGELSKTINLLLSSLLPLLGTWVGTVLAYYFSRENFESANRSVQEIVDRMTPREKLQSQVVKDAMIPSDEMTVVRLGPDADDAGINLKTGMLALLGGKITRLLVLDPQSVARYMIHQSMLYKFISEKSMEAAEKGDSFEVDKATLADFIGHGNMKDMVGKDIFAFVALNATLAEAKDAMDAVAGCQDVFVTKNGKANEAILGWLTNVDIAKYAEV